MKKKKFYIAVFVEDPITVERYEQWSVAQERIQGRPHLVKGFSNEEESYDWLRHLTRNDFIRALWY